MDVKLDKIMEMQVKLVESMQNLSRQMKQDVSELKQDMKEVKQDINSLKSDVKSIELTIENQIVPNIQLVAENHVDLSRKLHDSLRVESEREMFIIKLNYLEDEIRKLKAMM